MAVADLEQSTAERYESLIRIAASIRDRKDPRELFNILVHELGQVVDFDGIAQFDEASNKVAWHLCPGCNRPREVSLETDENDTIAAWVYQQQETVVLGTLDREDRFPASIQILRQAGLQSVCAFPLTTAHRRLGSLVMASVRRDAYSAEEVRFCGLVANQIALAMDDAINFRASEQAQERLQLLLDLTNRVVSNLNLRDVLREISANIRRVMQCDGVGIDLPRPGDGRLLLYALDFPNNTGIIEEGFEPPADEKASAAQVFRSGEAVILSRQELQSEPIAAQLEIQSLAHVPLKARSGIVGVLSLGARRENAFSADDLTFLTQIAHQVAIAVENAVAFAEVSDLKNKLAQEKLYLEGEIRSELKFDEIIGKSEALRRVLQQIETVASTDSTVLIYGETGTGKELVARSVHSLSSRRGKTFIKLNCAAVPAGLLESELFGHEKGAFTGAVNQKIGRIELADKGTLFLDEIGELPLELQPKLLRVLQDREFERLGGIHTLHVDVRIIAATNRDLHQDVADKQFREDLFYRLNVFPIELPPLRQRRTDIPILVRHFVNKHSARMGKHVEIVPDETMTVLQNWSWPGNIRELENMIERMVILSKGSVLAAPPVELDASLSVTEDNLTEVEREHIIRVLRETNGVLSGEDGAASRLGIKRTTLQSMLKRFGIGSHDYRGGSNTYGSS